MDYWPLFSSEDLLEWSADRRRSSHSKVSPVSGRSPAGALDGSRPLPLRAGAAPGRGPVPRRVLFTEILLHILDIASQPGRGSRFAILTSLDR